MGTDLESTLERIEWQTKYFITCCRPENEKEIEAALEVFKAALKNETAGK